MLDALRGFAIFGILLANATVFSGTFFAGMAGETVAFPNSTADRVTEFLIHLLVEGKFYSTFSLLFGVGFALQMVRTEALGRPFASVFRRRISFLLLIGVTHALVWAGDILWLYAVVGFYLGRRRVFHDLTAHRPLLRRLLIAGLLIGSIANLALAFLMETDAYFSFQALGVLQSAVYQIGVPALCLFYVSTFALLFDHASWRRRLLVFAPVGRTALSNYVLQTGVCLAIFYGIGLGLFGEWGVAATTALALVIYSAQVLISRWWLGHFRFGPLEWVWRSLTYGRAQRMTHA